jgi:ABC-type xylose transport system, periplasmic component
MEQCSHWQQAKQLFISGLLITTIFLSGCSTSQSQNTTSNSSSINGPDGANGKGCTKVGVLLPDTTSSTRWEAHDHPLLVKAIKDAIPGAQVDYKNANGNTDTQQSLAEQDLKQGDCILVIAPHDSVAAAKIVAEAKAQNVPVIAYDRFIQSSDTSFYVSFDGVAVGKMQAQYIVDHYEKYSNNGSTNVVMISGSQNDANALLFSKGVHSILDPYFAKNTLTFANEVFTPNWSAATAQTEISVQLSDTNQGIQVAYVANDDMANSVIAAIYKAGTAGNTLITGQDATPVGIHNILLGYQSMTVYKPSIKEAQATGSLVKALHDGTSIQSITHGKTVSTAEGSSIPSVLVTPILVDINNIKSTVIKDGYIQERDVCQGVANGTGGLCNNSSK